MIRFAQKKDLKEIAEIHLHNRKVAYQGIMNECYLNGLTQESVYEQWIIYYRKADKKYLYMIWTERLWDLQVLSSLRGK